MPPASYLHRVPKVRLESHREIPVEHASQSHSPAMSLRPPASPAGFIAPHDKETDPAPRGRGLAMPPRRPHYTYLTQPLLIVCEDIAARACPQSDLVASVATWAHFSDEWQQALEMKPRLDYFKMSKAMSFSRQLKCIGRLWSLEEILKVRASAYTGRKGWLQTRQGHLRRRRVRGQHQVV